MRILFLCNQWSVTREPTRLVGVHPELCRGRHHWIRAVSGSAVLPADIEYDLGRDSVRDIARRCPGGNPDVMIVWALGYQALPAGIEDAPFPVVACYSDWLLLMPEQAGMLPAQDYFFTCRGGVRVLNQMGYSNAEYWPMYGHDPLLARVLPGVEKTWDIGMIGNLSPVVQRERAAWLGRVARLADRYRVRIAGGVYNEEYVRLMNATKITFNRTLSGAMNMRCYEAAACGSLLFCEEENEEIREFFQDRVHCVLYNDRNLEELLDYYLSHHEEREQIAAAAAERVADYSLPRSLNRLADRMEQLDLRSRVEERRQRMALVADLPMRHARQALGGVSDGAKLLALACARQAHEAQPEDPAMLNDLAVVTAQSLMLTGDPKLRAERTHASLEHMRHAVERQPESVFYRTNLAHMYAELGRHEMALEQAQFALQRLGADTPAEDPSCLPFPFAWDEFRVQYALIYNLALSQPESFAALRRCLLVHRTAMLFGKEAEVLGLTEFALLGYRMAVAARSDLGSGHLSLGRVLARTGNMQAAVSALETGMELDPFVPEAWENYVDLLRRLGRETEARRFATERCTMLEALAPSGERLAMASAFADYAEIHAKLLALLQQPESPLVGGLHSDDLESTCKFVR